MLAEHRFDRWVVAEQRPGESHDHGPSLSGGATTGEVGLHTHLTKHVGGFEDGHHAVSVAGGAEIFFQGLAVAEDAGTSWLHSDSSHRGFASTGSPPPSMDWGGWFTGHKGVFGGFRWSLSQGDGGGHCGFSCGGFFSHSEGLSMGSEGHWLLGLVRMLAAFVHLEVRQHHAAEAGFGKHAADRFFDKFDGAVLLHPAVRNVLQTTGVTGVGLSHLLLGFATSERHLASVDHDHVITAHGMRGPIGRVLALENRRNPGGQSAKRDVGSINHNPFGFVGASLKKSGLTGHRGLLPLICGNPTL